MAKAYQIEILERSTLNKIAEVIAPYPLNQQGHILRFSNELSHYGQCTFRIATHDPIFTQYGDIIVPHRYHVRIRRQGAIVWQGAITDNPSRNKNYVEVVAHEYLFYLDKKRIKRDSSQPTGWVGATDGWQNYRYFATGTMATAVTNIVNEMLASIGSEHALDSMTLGTIENPNYPKNFTTSTGSVLSGAWSFSTDVVMQFDYHSVLHVLKSFGAVSNADFYIDSSLQFHFKKFVGVRQYDVGFVYGTFGNIIDYDVPRYGRRMVNDYYGLATDSTGNLLRIKKSDTTSINTYGLLEGSTAFDDVINKNILDARLAEDFRFLASPETAPINLTVDDKTYPIGTFGVGDIRNVKINDGIIDYNKPRRIVGITTIVHNTGKELVTIQTNEPRQEDLI